MSNSTALNREQIEALERLSSLQRNGVVGDSEFEAIKNIILSADAAPETSDIPPAAAAPTPSSAISEPLYVQKVGDDSFVINRRVTVVRSCVIAGIEDAGLRAVTMDSNTVRTDGGYWKYNGCVLVFRLKERGASTILDIELVRSTGLIQSGDRLLKVVIPAIRRALQRSDG